MLKIVAAGVTALCASILCTTPYSFRATPEGSVSLSLDSAAAVIGRPLTPMSMAGVHRRAYRRAHYGAYYHPYPIRAISVSVRLVGPVSDKALCRTCAGRAPKQKEGRARLMLFYRECLAK